MSPILTADQLEGIYEKLDIADQNIRNLNADITKFLDTLPVFELKIEGGRPVIGQKERDGWKKLQEYARKTKVPLRFSIRAGEIIHHLRSCLDHIAWQLSDPVKRELTPTSVQFPIITDWTDKKEVARYDRYTELITNTSALTLIKGLQPAGVNSPKDDLLWIIHHMDIIDKHRNLTIIFWVPRLHGPSKVTRDYAIKVNAQGKRVPIPIFGTLNVQMDAKVTLHIAFETFSKWQDQPVIKSLSDLTNRIREVVALFGK